MPGSSTPEPVGMRLNRYMARAGAGSRRACDSLIAEGRVRVNGRRPDSPGMRVAPGDRVEVSGRLLVLPEPAVFAWNKPLGVEVSMAAGDARLRTLMERLPPGCVPVGRLDINTGGLILLSNDGDLTFRLTHPRWGTEREYLVHSSADLPPGTAAALARGVRIGPGPLCRPVSFRVTGARKLLLVLRSGRYHEVRRIVEALGVSVTSLERLRFGPVRLEDLARGAFRRIAGRELAALYDSVGLVSS